MTLRKGKLMVDIRVLLGGLWIALMLTYLLGDVLRIFAGDFKAGEIEGVQVTQVMWLGIAIFMLVPIVMLVLTLLLPQPGLRPLTIGAAVVLFLFNLVALPTYPSLYDKFLIAVGLIFHVMTVIYAWTWAE